MSTELEKLREALSGDFKPIARFGVTLKTPVPWWRKWLQRYVAPRRFRLWLQSEILKALADE